MNPRYSVVIPVYNSASMLAELHQRLKQVFAQMGSTYEVIFVDDSSDDNSWKVLKGLKQENHDTVKIIQLSRNYGQHNATQCGFKHCTGDVVITIDDDLQHRPEDIPLLAERLDTTGADVVYAVARNMNAPVYRKAGSGTWKFFTRNLKQGYGDGSSYRMIRRDIVEKVASHQQHFIFIDQLLYWYTAHTEFVKVEYLPRRDGRSNYSPVKLFFLTSNLLIFYTTLPLKWMTYSGIALSLGSFVLAIYFIVRKVFFKVAVPGFTAEIVTLLFATSVMLLCFGIIGEYLARIYSLLNQKPTFSIRERQL